MSEVIEQLTKQLIHELKLNRIDKSLLSKPLASRLHPSNSESTVISFINANIASSAAVWLVESWLTSENPVNITCTKFRRVSRSRLQACCGCRGLDFIWESRSIGEDHDWKLGRMALEDPEDEEMYWRPWQLSLDAAEQEYNTQRLDDSDEWSSGSSSKTADSLSSVTSDDETYDAKLRELAFRLGQISTRPVTDRKANDDVLSFATNFIVRGHDHTSHTNAADDDDDPDDHDDEDAYWNRYCADDVDYATPRPLGWH
jgi:hypothetical protein